MWQPNSRLDDMNTTLQTVVKVTLPATSSQHLSLDHTSCRAYTTRQLLEARSLGEVRTELLGDLIRLLRGLRGYAFRSRNAILDKFSLYAAQTTREGVVKYRVEEVD